MPKRIVALLTDLMFMPKIQDAARRAGADVTFVKSEAEAMNAALELPAVIILDLNINNVDILAAIGQLKGNPETADVPLLGFVSHVQVELRQAAVDKGVDTVVARSVFAQNLPALLERYT